MKREGVEKYENNLIMLLISTVIRDFKSTPTSTKNA